MGQLLLKMLVGGVAGLAVWLLFEPAAPTLGGPDWGRWESWLFLVMGATIGLAVGGLNGWIQGSKVHLSRGAGLGLLFGAFGGVIGHYMGGALYSAFFPTNIFISSEYSVITKM